MKTRWENIIRGLVPYLLTALLGILIGVAFGLAGSAEAHPCSDSWQDGYIQSEPYCWQEAIADAYGNITYVTVCN